MYITGAGRTKFGKLDFSLYELMYEATALALKDARLNIKDIDAIIVSNALSALIQNQLHMNAVMSTLLKVNVPIIRVESTCASGGAAFFNGVNWLSRYKNVLIVGGEKLSEKDNSLVSNFIGRSSDFELDQEKGFIFPAGAALLIERFEEKNGDVMDVLAKISYKNHANANQNPLAHFYEKKVDLEKIKNSKKICGKLRLFDCSPTSDGAVALVLSTEKRDKRSIEIAACEMATGNTSISFENGYSFPAQRIAVANALKSGQVSRNDIDILEIHDGYTIVELISMIDLGFFDEKSAIMAIMNKETSLKGALPINTDGGLKANGHPIGATGLAQVYELVTQLRGEAGVRQVNAKAGLSHNIGGMVGSCIVSILRRC